MPINVNRLTGLLAAACAAIGLFAAGASADSPRGDPTAGRQLCLSQGGAFDTDIPFSYICVNPSGTQFTAAQLGQARKVCVGYLGGNLEKLGFATTEGGVSGPGYGCNYSPATKP